MHTPTGLIHLEYASDSDVGGHVYGFTGNSAMFESKTFIFMFFSSLYFYIVCSQTEWKFSVKTETIFVSMGGDDVTLTCWSVILVIGRCPSTGQIINETR